MIYPSVGHLMGHFITVKIALEMSLKLVHYYDFSESHKMSYALAILGILFCICKLELNEFTCKR